MIAIAKATPRAGRRSRSPDRRRYYPGLDSLLAAIRGEAPPERSLDHELTVQETLLRAIGLA